MFLYSIYGLYLRINEEIPGLIACTDVSKEDLQIWFGSFPDHLWSKCKDGIVWYASPRSQEEEPPNLVIYQLSAEGCFWLRYADGTEFVFDRRCSQVWAMWPENLTLEDTAIYLLGPVLGVLLYLRGVTCLHASAVEIDGAAIALVGESGAGKSTTAAAFAHLGHRVLSDDVVTLNEQDEAFIVHPAYPYIRLWPSSVELLYGKPDALPLLTPTWDKHCLHLIDRGHQFSAEPLPLAAVYILGDRSMSSAAPFVEAVTPNESLINLVANTYANKLLDKNGRAKEFELLGRLRNQLPIRRIIPHEDPAHLFKLCQVIAEDFRQMNAPVLASSAAVIA